MKKYQIYENSKENNNAGSKATRDVNLIGEQLGYSTLLLTERSIKSGFVGKAQRQLGYTHDWLSIYRSIESDSIVLLQNPFRQRQIIRNRELRLLKEKKNVKYISLVHDVEELRNIMDADYYHDEFQFMLDHSDVFIVHNQVMKDYFIHKGIENDRIVVLEIFDYLQTYEPHLPRFSASVVIAGNLDPVKSKYISELYKLHDIHFELFGSNYSCEKAPNVHYNGTVSAENLPKYLSNGFGLVWDGDRINTCCGNTGEYLKYNDPHKLSLYLSSGLPVIIWKQAAEAPMVEAYGLGICIDSLDELENILNGISAEKYAHYAHAVSCIAPRLCNGSFLRRAIYEAESRLQALFEEGECSQRTK